MNGATMMVIAHHHRGAGSAIGARKLRTNAAIQPAITTMLTSSGISR
jgi:hypothetical protein